MPKKRSKVGDVVYGKHGPMVKLTELRADPKNWQADSYESVTFERFHDCSYFARERDAKAVAEAARRAAKRRGSRRIAQDVVFSRGPFKRQARSQKFAVCVRRR